MGKQFLKLLAIFLLMMGLVVWMYMSQQQSLQNVRAPAPEGMVWVPAGVFTMGSNRTDTEGRQEEFGFRKPMYLDEHPAHEVDLAEFFIDKFEVSSGHYKAFVVQTAVDVPSPWVQNGYNVVDERLATFPEEQLRKIALDYFELDMDTTKMTKPALLDALYKVQRQRDALPVTAVNWFDAASYCRWLGKRLPTEAEWEKTARGESGYEYVWGPSWADGKANAGSGAESLLVPVGSFPDDRSAYGAFDMAGNVSEWVSDWYQGYPGTTHQSEDYGDRYKVVKGGGAGVGHYSLSYFFRAPRRGQADPVSFNSDVGFRCAMDVPLAQR